MTCPHCNVPLQMSERQGVEIDYCPQCRGVWLDRGELDKLVERSADWEVRPSSQPVSAPYRRDDDDDDDDHYRRHGRHRKRGLLGEIFDFG
jgi:Zn-finger nucleic acid-binding protein